MHSQKQILHAGDFLRSWQKVVDKTVDLILTDPPYGSLKSAQEWDIEQNYHVLGWIFDQLLSTYGQIAIFCDMPTAAKIILAFEPYFRFRFQWVWEKSSASTKNHTRPAINLENVIVFSRNDIRIKDLTFNYEQLKTPGKPYRRTAGKSQNENPIFKGGGNLLDVYVNIDGRRYPRSILKYANKPGMRHAERTGHPTQKPVGLLKDIITGLSNPGDLVLDPYLGSGSTLVATHDMNRRGIGFELNPEYCDMASKRITANAMQGAMP